MAKEYHIIYGEQAKAVIQQSQSVDFSNPNVEIIALMDNLNEGKLYDLKTLKGIEDRVKWFEEFYSGYIWSDLIKNNAKDCKFILETIQQNDQVFIWLGNDATEYVWKCAVVDFLKDLIVDINIIDWQNVIGYNVSGQEINLDYLSICNPENVFVAGQNFRVLAKSEKQNLIDEWNRIFVNNSDIRNLNTGNLEEGDASFFDEMLINRCTNEFQKGAYIVGMTLCDIYDKYKSGGIGDYYLFRRLEQLSETGQLEISELIVRGRDYANLFNVRLIGS